MYDASVDDGDTTVTFNQILNGGQPAEASMMAWIAHTTAVNAVFVVVYGPGLFPYHF